MDAGHAACGESVADKIAKGSGIASAEIAVGDIGSAFAAAPVCSVAGAAACGEELLARFHGWSLGEGAEGSEQKDSEHHLSF
jgi:hypothetical protein